MPEQQINSLERFRKRSPRLVLEEHSHGEVPSGCGGVVLRWRNPHRTAALAVYLYSPGKPKLFLDGNEIDSMGVDLAPGPHLLALALTDVDLDGGLFMFAALQQTQAYLSDGPMGLSGSPWRLVSQADRTWLATLDWTPAEDWKTAQFDDTSWVGLARFLPNPPPNYREPGAYPARWCNEFRAAFLALPPGRRGRGKVWVRKRFTVPTIETP